MELIVKLFIALACSYLYRLGGGNIWPFKSGFKAARRYILPLAIALIFNNPVVWLTMAIFSLICHFNLDEIEERDWDDIACYGLAQAACFWPVSGVFSLLIALSWVMVTYLSNIGLKGFKMDWAVSEAWHGLSIGLLVA